MDEICYKGQKSVGALFKARTIQAHAGSRNLSAPVGAFLVGHFPLFPGLHSASLLLEKKV